MLRGTSLTVVAAVCVFAFSVGAACADFVDPLIVGVSQQSLHFTWKSDAGGTVELWEFPMHTGGDVVRDAKVLWHGDVSTRGVVIPRFDGARDRLFAKFQIAEAK